tara:strand:+ start:3222 stop:3473 length:252 start_codon:yes stop_codon:yes gene_type:complete
MGDVKTKEPINYGHRDYTLEFKYDDGDVGAYNGWMITEEENVHIQALLKMWTPDQEDSTLEEFQTYSFPPKRIARSYTITRTG